MIVASIDYLLDVREVFNEPLVSTGSPHNQLLLD